MKYGFTVAFLLGVLAVPSCFLGDDDLSSGREKYFFVKGISVAVGTLENQHSEFSYSSFLEDKVIDTFTRVGDGLVLEVVIDSSDYVASKKEKQPFNFGNEAMAEPAPEPPRNAPWQIEMISDQDFITKDSIYTSGQDISEEFFFFDTDNGWEWLERNEYVDVKNRYHPETRIYMKLKAALGQTQSHRFTIRFYFSRHQVETTSKQVVLE